MRREWKRRQRGKVKSSKFRHGGFDPSIDAKVFNFTADHSKLKTERKSRRFKPTNKAKRKIKGTQKLKALDVVLNPRLLAWKAASGRKMRNIFEAFSAKEILHYLYSSSLMYSSSLNENDYSYEDMEESADCSQGKPSLKTAYAKLGCVAAEEDEEEMQKSALQ